MPPLCMPSFMPALCCFCMLVVVGVADVVSVVALTLVQPVTVNTLDIANTEPINNFFIIITLIVTLNEGANVTYVTKFMLQAALITKSSFLSEK